MRAKWYDVLRQVKTRQRVDQSVGTWPIRLLREALTALFLFAYALLTSRAGPAAALDLTHPLTAGQVACEEARLETILPRFATNNEAWNGDQYYKSLAVSIRDTGGTLDALEVRNEGQRARARPSGGPPSVPLPEVYLAFHADPTVRSLLLNPGRRPLPQISLTREDGSSTLVRDALRELETSFDPTIAGGVTTGLASINNLLPAAPGAPEPGDAAAATVAGRGLAGLPPSCGSPLTPFDRAVFLLLQRMVRVLPPADFAPDLKLAIFRGEDPHVFRVDVYKLRSPREAEEGRLALSVRVEWTDTGSLITGELSILPLCTGGQTVGCTSGLPDTMAYLIPPVAPGQLWSSSGRIPPLVIYGNTEGFQSPAAVDFAALLANTDWNPPPQ